MLVFGLQFVVVSGCNDLQYCGHEDFAKDVRRLTLRGPVGRCAFAHIIQLLECPGEVWNTQRAFLLPITKAVPFTPVVPAETLKPHALIGLHFLQQKVKLDQAVVSLLTLETCGDTVA